MNILFSRYVLKYHFTTLNVNKVSSSLLNETGSSVGSLREPQENLQYRSALKQEQNSGWFIFRSTSGFFLRLNKVRAAYSQMDPRLNVV